MTNTKGDQCHNKVSTFGVSYPMNKRTTDRMASRPEIPSIKITGNMSAAENFQNTVLRPIIKMKNDILLAHFKKYIAVKKVDYIESVFRNDHTFRSELRGLVIGNFTLTEYIQYTENQNDINKRMINIVRQRITDHLDTLSI